MWTQKPFYGTKYALVNNTYNKVGGLSEQVVSYSTSVGGKRPKPMQEVADTPYALDAQNSGILTSNNHAFHVGKIIKQVGDGVMAFLGWDRDEERLYNRIFFETMLDALFQNLKPGEKGRVVIWRILSELCNGPEDVKKSLSVQQEKDLIYRVAQEKFGKTKGDMEVIALEDIPEHEPLLSSMQNARGSNNTLNPEEVFGTEALPQNPRTSLEIAQCLYAAAQEDPKFMEHLQKPRPGKVKKRQREEELRAASYYALTEVAIRMSELLAGRSIQGGERRQDRYDSIIRGIIKGGDGYDTNALKKISEAFKDREFHTIHVATEKSADSKMQKEKNKRRKRRTKWSLALAAMTTLTTAWQCHKQQAEKEHHQMIDEEVQKQLNGKTCRLYQSVNMSTAIGIDILNGHAKRANDYFQYAYNIQQSDIEKLKLLENFKNFLIQKMSGENSWPLYCDYSPLLMKAIQLFIHQNKMLLTEAGIQTGPPYEHLRKYWEELEALAKAETVEGRSNANREINLKNPCTTYPDCDRSTPPTVEEIGIIVIESVPHKLYLLKNKRAEETIMVAKPLMANDIPDIATAQRAARSFVEDLSFYDTLVLREWENKLRETQQDKDVLSEFEVITAEEVEKYKGLYLRKEYKDSLGSFQYIVIKSSCRKKGEKFSVECTLARTPEEPRYTVQTSWKAAGHYFDAQYSP